MTAEASFCLAVARRVKEYYEVSLRIDTTPIKIKIGKKGRKNNLGFYSHKDKSITVFPEAHYDLESLLDTILHEIAHLVTNQNYFNASAHGPQWRNYATALGANPRATQYVDHKYVIPSYLKDTVEPFYGKLKLKKPKKIIDVEFSAG